MEQLLRSCGRLLDAAESAAGEVLGEPAEEHVALPRWHARADGLSDSIHVERHRRLQDSLHSFHGGAFPAGDAGAWASAEEGHAAHVLRHARLRVPSQRQLQTSNVPQLFRYPLSSQSPIESNRMSSVGHAWFKSMVEIQLDRCLNVGNFLLVLGRVRIDRQTRRPRGREQGRRELQRTLQHHVRLLAILHSVKKKKLNE